MRIGISPFAASAESALELSALAVEGGLDTLWLGDRYLSNPDFGGWSGGMETFTGPSIMHAAVDASLNTRADVRSAWGIDATSVAQIRAELVRGGTAAAAAMVPD